LAQDVTQQAHSLRKIHGPIISKIVIKDDLDGNCLKHIAVQLIGLEKSFIRESSNV
jgi:hypothetical protein